ncbi:MULTISPECIES: AI-2E family transporter [Bacillus]|uniref:AI-2E family transporter n=1 Tax=Bacillus TaxID=1386 RepID=UPI000D022BFA|nr:MULTISPECIES: AI-2E family transporter [Bacillus]MDR6747155.1 putative PurR-regulated permease PerM [Bacillus pumilus]PRS32487.1 AI-2E family transporter [Bacillus pumilus]UDF15357.1 AI-2E family transporter [Bacillus pumilus]
MKKRPIQFLIYAAGVLLVLASLLILLQLDELWMPIFLLLKAVLIPLLIAIFISYLLYPIVEKLHAGGLPRTVSLLLIYVLFFGGIGLAVYKGAPVMIKQLNELSEQIPVLAETYNGALSHIHHHTNHWPDGLHDRLDRLIVQSETYAANGAERMILSCKVLLDYALVAALIPFLVFYMVKDMNTMKRAAWYLTPPSFRKRGHAFVKAVDESLGNYIRGQLLVCSLIGGAAAIVLWLFHIPYPLVLGMLIGATNVIPYFGPIIGAVPAVFIAFTISVKSVMIVLITVAVLQFLESNVLSPIIVGRSLHMHPVVIMLVLLAGGELFGLIGMILAVPTAAIIRVIIVQYILMRRSVH